MTDDMMQVENERYLPAAFFVLPLASGRIALLSPRRDLYKIVETWEEAKACGPLASKVEKQRHTPSRIKLNLGGLL